MYKLVKYSVSAIWEYTVATLIVDGLLDSYKPLNYQSHVGMYRYPTQKYLSYRNYYIPIQIDNSTPIGIIYFIISVTSLETDTKHYHMTDMLQTSFYLFLSYYNYIYYPTQHITEKIFLLLDLIIIFGNLCIPFDA